MADPQADESGDLTGLLREAAHGNRAAFDRLVPLVYEELRRLAHGKLRLERAGHTLDTTALVHEAYLRLVDQTRVEWSSRHHFFAVASESMRRILIDYARRRCADKRGANAGHFPLEAADSVPVEGLLSGTEAEELLELDDALNRLAGFNPDGAKVVQFRFFGGLTNHEVAEVLGTSERSVRRVWTVAKGWLARELARSGPGRQNTLLDLLPGSAT